MKRWALVVVLAGVLGLGAEVPVVAAQLASCQTNNGTDVIDSGKQYDT